MDFMNISLRATALAMPVVFSAACMPDERPQTSYTPMTDIGIPGVGNIAPEKIATGARRLWTAIYETRKNAGCGHGGASANNDRFDPSHRKYSGISRCEVAQSELKEVGDLVSRAEMFARRTVCKPGGAGNSFCADAWKSYVASVQQASADFGSFWDTPVTPAALTVRYEFKPFKY
jgi:hypothetical protein